MPKKYYDPTLCTCSPENPMNMCVLAVLTEPIDGDILRESAEMLRERFPYFYVRAKAEHNDIITVPNPLPLTVRNTWEPIDIASKEANYHLAALKYEGKRVALEISHSISDGAGTIPYFKSLMYVYLSRKTGIAFPAEGFRLPGSIIPESETGDPFAGVDTDSADKPLYQKPPAEDFYRIYPDARGEDRVFFLKMPENTVMRYCKDNDGSPNVIMAVLLARAMRRADPESEKTISISIATDHKAMLGNFDNYRMFANAYEIDFPKKRENEDILKMCTLTRGQLILQAQPENSAWYIKTRKLGFEKMKAMPLQMKMDMLPKAASAKRWTAAVSYANSRSFGPLDPYIDEFYALGEVSSSDILCEISCINHSFFLSFIQSFSSRKYLDAFMRELEEAEIPCEIMREEKHRLCGFRYDDLF